FSAFNAIHRLSLHDALPILFGYACTETEELMPMPIMLAHKLVRGLSDARRTGGLDYLRPDGKSQVSIEYDGPKPIRVDTVVVSTDRKSTRLNSSHVSISYAV